MHTLHLIILASLFNVAFCRTDIFLNGTFYSTLNSPSIRIHDDFEFQEQVIIGSPPYGCDPFDNKDDIKGHIVWIRSDSDSIQNCRISVKLKHAEDAGAIAVILETVWFIGGEGFTAYFCNWELTTENKDIDIKGVEIARHNELRKLLHDKSLNITAHIKPGINHLTQMQGSITAFSVIFGLYALGLLFLAGWKLRQFVLFYGWQSSVSQIVLWMEIITSIIRLLLVIDPNYARGVYPPFISTIWEYLAYPFVLSETLLITFYWEEAMRSAKSQSYPSLHLMKKPFIATSAFLFLVSFICIILRAMNVWVEQAPVLAAAVAFLTGLPVLIFYGIGGTKILRVLHKSKSVTGKSSALYRITVMLLIVAAAQLGAIVFLIGLYIFPFSLKWWTANLFLRNFFMFAMSLFQLLAFQNPDGSGSYSPDGNTVQLQKSKSDGAKQNVDLEQL